MHPVKFHILVGCEGPIGPHAHAMEQKGLPQNDDFLLGQLHNITSYLIL
jgi:hypothetical protein